MYRKGPPDTIVCHLDSTIPLDRLANCIPAFRGNRYTDGFKTEFMLQICLYLFADSCQIYIQSESLCVHGKQMLGNALF